MLDLLQDGQAPAGGGEPVPLDVRVIASVSRNLEHALAHGLLLPELYYYLNVVHLYIPPLRHRQQDIPALAEQFLLVAAARRGASRGGAAPSRFSQEAWQCLLNYDWPGNAPQLAGVVAHAVVVTEGAEIAKASIAEASAKCVASSRTATPFPSPWWAA